MVKKCLSRLKEPNISILEPSVGDGVFLSEAHCKNKDAEITAVDIDPSVIGELKHSFRNQLNVELIHDDFLNFAIDRSKSNSKKFNAIIGNPPFIRRHNFSQQVKDVLAEFCREFDQEPKNLKNTWAAFLVASCKIVKSDGLLVFVLPYELLTVRYGKQALRMVSEQFNRVDVYISDEKAFSDIDQDAVILIANGCSDQPPGTFLNKVQSFEALDNAQSYKISISDDEFSGLELNSFLLDTKAKNLAAKLRNKIPTIANYANSAPGIVTAANDFFIRKIDEISALGLSEYTRPILRKGSFASRSPIFRKSEFDNLECHQATRFLHLTGKKETLSKEALSYISLGEADKLDQRYKCRNRENWYEVPLVSAKEGFFFKRSHSYPRLIINEAAVLTTDTAYGLTMKEGYSIRGLCFSFYNSLTMLFAEMDGRFYGGGVLELSPTEFRGLPLVYREPSEEEFKEFLNVHENPHSRIDEILEFGDKLLIEKLNITSKEVEVIRSAWKAVRQHRLRHGGKP